MIRNMRPGQGVSNYLWIVIITLGALGAIGVVVAYFLLVLGDKPIPTPILTALGVLGLAGNYLIMIILGKGQQQTEEVVQTEASKNREHIGEVAEKINGEFEDRLREAVRQEIAEAKAPKDQDEMMRRVIREEIERAIG